LVNEKKLKPSENEIWRNERDVESSSLIAATYLVATTCFIAATYLIVAIRLFISSKDYPMSKPQSLSEPQSLNAIDPPTKVDRPKSSRSARKGRSLLDTLTINVMPPGSASLAPKHPLTIAICLQVAPPQGGFDIFSRLVSCSIAANFGERHPIEGRDHPDRAEGRDPPGVTVAVIQPVRLSCWGPWLPSLTHILGAALAGAGLSPASIEDRSLVLSLYCVSPDTNQVGDRFRPCIPLLRPNWRRLRIPDFAGLSFSTTVWIEDLTLVLGRNGLRAIDQFLSPLSPAVYPQSQIQPKDLIGFHSQEPEHYLEWAAQQARFALVIGHLERNLPIG
jgi:hypothetical protein